MSSDDDWITTNEAAEISGYNVQYVRYLARSGKINGRKFGNTWMVEKPSLLNYITEAIESGDRRSGAKREARHRKENKYNI